MITFLAPLFKCFKQSSLFTNLPVDSTTISTPKSFHGISLGSPYLSIFISLLFIVIVFSSLTFTSPLNIP